MKNKIAYTVAIAAILTGCGDKQEPTPAPNPVEVTFSSTIAPYVEQTRATGSAWSQADEVGVFMVKAGETLSASSIVDHAVNRNFITTGDGNFKALNPNHTVLYPADGSAVDFVAYHPYRSDSRVADFKYRVDVGDQSADNLYLLYSNNSKGVTAQSTTNALQFTHHLSRLVLDVTLAGGLNYIDDATVTIEGINTGADFSLADARFTYVGDTGEITPRLLADPGGFDAVYDAVVIPTQSTTETRTVVFDIPEVGVYSYDIPATTNFLPGKIHHWGVTVSPSGVVVTTGEIEDWTGKDDPVESGRGEPVVVIEVDEEAMNLPNSYIVAPGASVDIPVAKAYAMWKYDPLLKDMEAKMTGLVAAKMVWEIPQYLMSTGSITMTGTGPDAVIRVTAGETVQDGNMTVGLYIDDEIVWSWHVWITPYNPNLPASQKTNNGVTMMDRNLGAWNTPANPAQLGKLVGHTYQWGRKDPLLSINAFMGGMDAMFKADGSRITLATKIAATGNAQTNLVASIRTPFNFITSSGADVDWWTTEGEDDGVNRWNNADGSKSPYDPCPEGWRVPTSGAGNKSPWYGLSTGDGTWSSTNYSRGWTFDNLGFIPAGGYFNTAGGVPPGGVIGTMVQLWTATQSPTDGYAYCLRADNSSWSPDFELARASAMPVRCAKVQ
ncbi:MAG: fimbrillin family protein [Alistipes sp.]|jgi:hypothetical protein|nr:fimbrillin family protein [Alistipes sp.]